MCDANFALEPSAAVSSTLSLAPGNIPYLVLGVGSASFLIYALQYNCPSAKLGRLNTALGTAEETFNHAKAKCKRDYSTMVETETRILRAKLTASKFHTRLLEARDMPSWKEYLQNIISISRSLTMLQREVRDIQTSLLVLIEAANRRKLTEDIRMTQEALDRAMPSGRVCIHGQTSASDYEV
ncbi:hypothetical protein B0H12DRAFT_1237319 [Mycena haematopus]|nr:hypothetical protein B0H12DRAFT_1237319 [Mycena haematopus]